MLPWAFLPVLASQASSEARKICMSRTSSYCRRGVGKVLFKWASIAPRPTELAGAAYHSGRPSTSTSLSGALRSCSSCCWTGVSCAGGQMRAWILGRIFRKPAISAKERNPHAASTTAEVTSPRMLRSLSSWPCRTWPPVLCGTKVSLSMFGLQHLHKVGIVHRHQGALLQSREKQEQPDAAQGDGAEYVHGRIERVKTIEAGIGSLVKLRSRQPEQIDQAHDQDQHRDQDNSTSVAFQAAREQQSKRKNKVHE